MTAPDVRRVARPAAALAVLVGLVVGVPYALLRWGRWPINGIPTWDQIGNLPESAVADSTLFGILTLAAWLTWAAFIASLAVEVLALRHGRDHNLPGLGPIQRRVRVLLAWLVMSVSAGGPVISPLVVTLPPVVMEAAVEAGQPAPAPQQPIERQKTPARQEARSTRWRTVAVEAGDSAWSIAEQHYGSGNQWRQLWNDSKDVQQPDGRRWTAPTDPVEPGWELRIQGSPTAAPDAAPTDPPSLTTDHATVLVEPGDNFWKLATRCLAEAWGRPPAEFELAPYWQEMIEVNRNRLGPPGDPDLIYPGQEFVVPAAPPSPDMVAVAVGPPPEPVVVSPAPPPDAPTQPSAPGEDPVTTTTSYPGSPDSRTERMEPDSESTSDQDDSNRLAEVAARVGATAALAAVTLKALARRRSARRRALRPGSMVGPRPIGDIETEFALAATSEYTVERAWLGARALARPLESNPDLPAIAGLVVRPSGETVVHFTDPVPPVAPFVKGLSPSTWLLPDEVEAQDEVGPVLETLVTLGRNEDGETVYVDLESLGVLQIHGPADVASCLLRSIVAELALQPLDHYLDLIVVGPDGLEETEQGVVRADRLDEDVVRRVEGVVADCLSVLSANAVPSTPAARSCGVERDGLIPTVVVVAVDADPTMLNRLAEAALPGGNGLALVTLDPVTAGGARLEVTADGLVHLPHLELVIKPAGLTRDVLYDVDDLLKHEPTASSVRATPVAVSGPDQEPPWDFCVRVLADCQVETPDGEAISFRYGENPAVQSRNANRGPELLAYLALRPDRSASSDEIRDHLWWGRPIGSHSIDNLLSSTRKVLGGESFLSHAEGATDRRRYHLRSSVVTDVELLSRAVIEARLLVDEDSTSAVAMLSSHLNRVEGSAFRSGHLGEGLAEWAAAYRILDRIEEPVVDAALLAAHALRDQGAEHLPAALRLVDRALLVSETNEALARAAMHLEAALGKRDAALSRYTALATLLLRDDLAPETETTSLRNQIAGRPAKSAERG